MPFGLAIQQNRVPILTLHAGLLLPTDGVSLFMVYTPMNFIGE
jgi:hypothetical protein